MMSSKNQRKAFRKLVKEQVIYAGYETLFNLLTMEKEPKKEIDEYADHLRFLCGLWHGNLSRDEIDHYYSNHGFSDSKNSIRDFRDDVV